MILICQFSLMMIYEKSETSWGRNVLIMKLHIYLGI